MRSIIHEIGRSWVQPLAARWAKRARTNLVLDLAKVDGYQSGLLPRPDDFPEFGYWDREEYATSFEARSRDVEALCQQSIAQWLQDASKYWVNGFTKRFVLLPPHC